MYVAAISQKAGAIQAKKTGKDSEKEKHRQRKR